MNTGYDIDWNNRDKDKANLFQTIQINIAGNKINFIRQLLARILLGQIFEKFIILRGSGGNGKSSLLELLYDTLGGYGHSIDINNLLNSGKLSCPNPEIDQIHNKLFIVSSEPPEEAKFKTLTVKRLTGGTKWSSRELFSNQTQINFIETTIVDSNLRLPFQGEIYNALIRRLIDYEFPNLFTDDEKKIGTEISTAGEYKRLNEYYKSQEFKDAYKVSLMQILLDLFKETKGRVVIPEIINITSLKYLTETRDVLKWFYDNYERIDEDDYDEEDEQDGLT